MSRRGKQEEEEDDKEEEECGLAVLDGSVDEAGFEEVGREFSSGSESPHPGGGGGEGVCELLEQEPLSEF